MKMHDLGDKAMPTMVGPKREQRYYPSVTIEDAEDLADHPLGKKLSFAAEGVIDRHEEQKDEKGTKRRTTIKLHSIGVKGGAKDEAPMSMQCPKCGRLGKGPYCATCGQRMKSMKEAD